MKKSFLIYQDWEEIFNNLSDANVGRLLKAMMAHARGKKYELPSKLLLIFIPIRQQLDRNLKNYKKVSEINRNNANKRWNEAKKDANAYDGMRPHTNAYDKDKDNDKDKDINNNSSSKETKEQIQNTVEVGRQPNGIDLLLKYAK